MREILLGLASLFDFAGVFFPRPQPIKASWQTSKYSWRADRDALASDWQAIAGDMQRAHARLLELYPELRKDQSHAIQLPSHRSSPRRRRRGAPRRRSSHRA